MSYRWWWAIPIVFLAFIIGVTNLYDGLVSQAEVNSLRHIALHHQPETKSIPEILNSIVTLSPQHAPLYFITLKYWYSAFGADPGIIRLFSIFCGVLTVAMVYRLGTTLGGKRVGLYAGLFIVSSWAFMYYIHEIRQYAFLLFVSSGAIWCYWRIVTYKGRVPILYWVGLFVFSAMSIYIHYFGILGLMGIGVYHVLFVRKNMRWATVVLVEGLAGLVFLPWLTIMVTGMQTMPDLSDRALSPLNVLYELLFFHSNGLWFVLLGLLLVVGWRYRKLSNGQRFAVIVLLSMVLAIFGIHQMRPILFEGRLRYIIIFLPMIAIVAGIGLAQLGRLQRLVMLVPIALFVSGMVFVRSDILHDYTGLDRTPPYDEILRQIDTLPGMYEPLVSLGSDEDNTVVSFQVRDYYGKLTSRRILHYNDTKPLGTFGDTLRDVTDKSVGFWLLYWSQRVALDEMQLYQEAVRVGYQSCGIYRQEDSLELHLMLKNTISCDVVGGSPLAIYDNGSRLSGVWTEVNEDILDVFVWWDDIPFEQYGVSLQVFDSDNNKVLQDDFVIVEGLHHRQLAWNNTDTGQYQLQMILYTRDDVSSIGGRSNMGVVFERSFVADTIVVDS